ncbi:hypothetical protein N7541_011948 [Penicillium brevicompactum]|uniref:Uncharacterized protein n=1 Tax=Penicillium brevicompactum TaxID=5074 RepID=A0A9W9QUG8_PENBR|nr:hypothetical protein N7541_011948 [Penicillium brevicompactum]
MCSSLSADKSSCPRAPAPGLLISSSVTSAVPPRPASLSSCNQYLSTLSFFHPGSGTRSRSFRSFALRIEEKFLAQTSTKQQKSPFKALPRIHHVHYLVQGLPLNRRRPGNELPCFAAACRNGFVTAHRTNIPVDGPRGIMQAFCTGMLQQAALIEEQQELSLFQDPNNSCSTFIAALSVTTLDTTKAQPLGDLISIGFAIRMPVGCNLIWPKVSYYLRVHSMRLVRANDNL